MLYFWGGFQGVWLTLPLVAYSCLGIAQYYVGLFRGNLIRPSDILAAGTALSVSGGYSYEIGAYQVLALGVSGIGFALLAFMFPLRHGEKRGSGYFAKRFVARFGGGIAVIVAAVLAFSNISFSQDLCLSDDYWDYLNVCRGQGYAASFVMLLQNALIVPPEDYSAHSAELLVEDYVERYNTTIGNGKSRQEAVAQFESEQPTVIAIMNEAFSDLSIYNGLEANYQGPTQIKGISDALYTGYVFSSVVGGGTCNSEFEFLSGASMRFIGADNMAYVMYNLSDAPALPKQLALSGYEATAIHPNDRMNWNRSAVYEQMGFDQFLDITAFDDDAPTRHMGISDSATYELILELMESSDKPQFIFDVTMQNHSSYGQLDLSDSELVELDTDWFSGDFYTEIKEYISLIEASERELMDFLDELRSINRPVVVVFFGDHQPSQGSVLNQWMSPDADVSDPNYYERPYQVPYIIWANYDVAGNDQVSERLDMGIQSLGPILLNAIGAPLTDWQMASLSALEEVPVLNGYGYRTADGVWHSFDGDSEVVRAVRDLEWMQYLEYETHL